MIYCLSFVIIQLCLVYNKMAKYTKIVANFLLKIPPLIIYILQSCAVALFICGIHGKFDSASTKWIMI